MNSLTRSQSGFSVIKFLILIAILLFVVPIAYKLLVIHQTSWKVQDIFDGKYCGACHGKVAFTNMDCQLCHTKVGY